MPIIDTPVIEDSPFIEDTVIETLQNISIQGNVTASPATALAVGDKPQKGTVTINGLQFTYQPYKDMTGSDQFTVYAVNSQGAASREAVVTVYIDKNSTEFSYVDMGGNPSAYAAVMLYQNDVYAGHKAGTNYFFRPEQQVTRGDFLLLLISACGLESQLQPTVNTGLPNDTDIPVWLKPYVRAAIDSGILPEQENFIYDDIPTRAEAVVMLDRAARISDVKDYHLTMPDLSHIPNWALPSYKNLAAYKMLDLYEEKAFPNRALTNSYAADLAWQLYKHLNR